MSYMGKVNGRGKFGSRPRPSLYEQWGMEAARLVSTGRYRGDTGELGDLYLIRPRGDGLLRLGMTVLDLGLALGAAAFLAAYAYVLGPGMDAAIDALGW